MTRGRVALGFFVVAALQLVSGGMWLLSIALGLALSLSRPAMIRVEVVIYEVVLVLTTVSGFAALSVLSISVRVVALLVGTALVIFSLKSAPLWIRVAKVRQHRDIWKEIDAGNDPTL